MCVCGDFQIKSKEGTYARGCICRVHLVSAYLNWNFYIS
jgi:hypothetical protein